MATTTFGYERQYYKMIRKLIFLILRITLFGIYIFLGFKVNSGEYKLMGLAPYGEPAYVDDILEKLLI